MKTLLFLFAAAWPGLVCAAMPVDSGAVPEGIAPSDWAGIRAAHEAARHAPQREADGDLVARNPGQQWRAEFDGEGFTVSPDHGAWTWGLELTGYGDRTLSAASSSQLRHEGAKITCQRDENLTEWFINDSRGLEQGWDFRQRPERADPTTPLQLHLTTRGNVRPQVNASGESVSFQEANGGSALCYGGLKAWDADGKKLALRFEQADGTGIRIVVDEQSARYPITIDPIAQQAYLKGSNTDYNDYFGSCVAVSGDTAVVGAYMEASALPGGSAIESGGAYVFVRTGTTWTQQAYLRGHDTKAYDRFGFSVGISGDTLLVGTQSAQSVYVFTRSGTTWTQQAYLKASNAGPNDEFGQSVAISGDTLVIGAKGEDSNASGVDGDQANDAAFDSGAAYVFARSGTTWTQQAYLKASNTGASDQFGNSVTISGDTVAVAAASEDSNATGVDGDQANNTGTNAGAVYIFTRNGTTWTQQAYLKASNASVSDTFGNAVAMSGDTLIVGAPNEDSGTTGVNGDQANNTAINSGAAYVFTRSGTVWTQQAYLKASNTGASDQFGAVVAASGDTVAVGAYFESSSSIGVNGDQSNNNASSSGAAYVFTRSGTAWSQQSYLKASNTGQGDLFGAAIAVSGDTVVVGAQREDGLANGVSRLHPSPDNSTGGDAGAAYIFHLNLPTLPGDIVVRKSSAPILKGGTTSLGPAVIGSPLETTFEIGNTGPGPLLLTGSPPVTITGSNDFIVSAEPANSVAPSEGSTFKVRFAPTSEGLKSATISIASSDGYSTPFVQHLSAIGLSSITDTDGDGLNDALEFNLAALNFDWQVKQSALVDTYLAHANAAGSYAPEQVLTLRPGPTSIVQNPANGRAKLTTLWKKSTNLRDFFNFPAPANSAVSISPSGAIEFEFDAPEQVEFFRIEDD